MQRRLAGSRRLPGRDRFAGHDTTAPTKRVVPIMGVDRKVSTRELKRFNNVPGEP
jgi:hypothetical protein